MAVAVRRLRLAGHLAGVRDTVGVAESGRAGEGTEVNDGVILGGCGAGKHEAQHSESSEPDRPRRDIAGGYGNERHLRILLTFCKLSTGCRIHAVAPVRRHRSIPSGVRRRAADRLEATMRDGWSESPSDG